MDFTPPSYSVVLPFKNAHFRGQNATEVRIRVLSFWDMQESRRAAAASVMQEHGEIATWSDYGLKLIAERTAVEMIVRACQSVQELKGSSEDHGIHYAMIFPSTTAVTKNLTIEEFQELWTLVESVQHPFMGVDEEDDGIDTN